MQVYPHVLLFEEPRPNTNLSNLFLLEQLMVLPFSCTISKDDGCLCFVFPLSFFFSYSFTVSILSLFPGVSMCTYGLYFDFKGCLPPLPAGSSLRDD